MRNSREHFGGDSGGGSAQNGQPTGAGTAIDLKAGLWDSVLHVSTILPETNVDTPELEKQLAKLTPEERAKTIAGLKKQTADTRESMKNGSDTKTKFCFTAKQFESGNLLRDLQGGNECVEKMNFDEPEGFHPCFVRRTQGTSGDGGGCDSVCAGGGTTAGGRSGKGCWRETLYNCGGDGIEMWRGEMSRGRIAR